METASTWDSYRETLQIILDNFKPEHVFEWGVGESSEMFLAHSAVVTLDTVEHDPRWFDQYKHLRGDRFNLILEPSLDVMYALVSGRFNTYDLIFIDGRVREICLEYARSRLDHNGIVILHDAERKEYHSAMRNYRFLNFSDNGHTAVMTESEEVNNKMRGLLQCA